jgi:hypothetical protein
LKESGFVVTLTGSAQTFSLLRPILLDI